MKGFSGQALVRSDKSMCHELAISEPRRSESHNLRMCVKARIEGGKKKLPSVTIDDCSEHKRTHQPPTAKLSIPSRSSVSSPSKSKAENMCRKVHTTTKGSCIPCCAQKYADTFAKTYLDPPVSVDSLSELDQPRMWNDLFLRHDLNFDPKNCYRPITHGLRGEQRRIQIRQYWDAIRAELDIWLRNGLVCSSVERSRTTSPITQSCSSHALALKRLPRIFGAVQNILKTLMQEDEWVAIDARLDTDLLMQQLSNGALDLVALSDWLAVLLRRYCSSRRYQLVDSMASSIRNGVERAEAGTITTGLVYLFDILENMKLDAANYQVKYSTSLMVNGTVAFEQGDFIGRIEDGWDPREAQTWLANQRQNRRLSSGASTIIPAITSMIIHDEDYLPPTFTLDYTRLRSLQTEFQNLIYRAACLLTFEAVLKMLGCNEPMPQSFSNDLFARVWALTSNEHSPRRQVADVALELVRRAYKVCKIPKVPSSSDLDFAERHLQEACEHQSDIFKYLERSLGDELGRLTEQEVDTIGNFSPVQIMNRYQSEGSSAPSTELTTQHSELLHMAQQLAHIIVLHWRIWAPLIYKEPLGARFQDSSLTPAAPAALKDLHLQCSQAHEEYSRQNCRRDCASELRGAQR